MIAGIVLLAVGLKKVQGYVGGDGAHSLRDVLPVLPLSVMCGGVALFLLGHAAFTYRAERRVKVQRIATAAVLLAAIPPAAHLPALGALGLVTGIMMVLIAGEAVRFSEDRERIRDEEAAEPR